MTVVFILFSLLLMVVIRCQEITTTQDIITTQEQYYDRVLPPPYIRTRCNLGEPTGRAFCIDPAKRDPPYNWDRLNGHSCKPIGGLQQYYRDEQWTFGDPNNILSSSSSSSSSSDEDDEQIGLIYGASTLITGYCLRALNETAPGDVTGVLCNDTAALSVWSYKENSGEFVLIGSPDSYEDESGSQDEDEDESGDGGIDLCLKIGNVSVVTGRDGTWRRRDLSVDDCDNSGDDGLWDIITESGVDTGPSLDC